MPILFPCGICCKPVASNHRAVQCDVCNLWIHIKCNSISPGEYEKLKETEDLQWFCVKCFKNNVPFSDTPNEILNLTLQGKNPHYTPVLISKQDSDGFVSLLKTLEKIDFGKDPDDPGTFVNDCNYYTLSEFNEIKTQKNRLNFFHQNIASLSLHFDELSTILDNSLIKFDFIGITETGFNFRSDIHDLKGYRHLDCLTESTKGGVRLYFSENFNYKRRKDLRIYESKKLESVFIEVLSERSKENMIIGCIYKHPEMNISDFNKSLHSLLQKVSNEKKKLVLMGDFNVDLLKIDIHDDSSSYFDLITSFGLFPTILRPSRITSRSKTLIDNIFCNFSDIDTLSGNLTCSISDHLPQFSTFNFTIDKKKEKCATYFRNWKSFNREEFLLDFLDIDWEKELNFDHPNLNLNKFISKTNDLINMHVPMKRARFKNIPKRPWITKGILTSISHKNVLYKKCIKEKNVTKRESLFTNFKSYRNWVTKIIRISKTAHYQNFFAQNKTNLRETWKGIRSLVSCKVNRHTSPTSLLINDTLDNNPLNIANCFNTFFGSIARKTKDKIRPINKSFSDYLDAPTQSSLFLSPIDACEIGKIICSLDENKAHGPNSIPTKFLKLLSPTCSKVLSSIFNSCLRAGIYPSCLKTANVIPVFKKESPLDPSNYRPISLLSNINKIFEKTLHSRLTSFLDKHSILYSLQFGFRKGYSTSHAVLYLTELIHNAIDKGGYACGVFLDLQKAFDTVDHSILLQKMSHYGVRGLAYSLFKSYLQDRSQFVTINGKSSEKCHMEHGVPQGSVLGPLLFLIYINDLNKSIKHSKTIHFADDTSLLNCDTSLKNINKHVNHDLRLLNDWLRANKISLNANKTEIILFRSSRKVITKSLNFRISGQKILPKSCVTYLGVKLNEFLNWDEHFTNLIPKLSRANGMIAKIRHYVDRVTLINIYYAIFDSHLNYCSLVWGKLPRYIMDKIRSLQNKALRLMFFQNIFSKTGPMYLETKILPFQAKLIKQQCIFAFDQQRKTIPAVFSDFCQRSSRASKQTLFVPGTNTVYHGTNSVKTQVAKSWNWVISCLKEKEKLQEFSKNKFSKQINEILLKKFT